LHVNTAGEWIKRSEQGVLPLQAYSVATIVEPGNLVVGEFDSVSDEVDECPL